VSGAPEIHGFSFIFQFGTAVALISSDHPLMDQRRIGDMAMQDTPT